MNNPQDAAMAFTQKISDESAREYVRLHVKKMEQKNKCITTGKILVSVGGSLMIIAISWIIKNNIK